MVGILVSFWDGLSRVMLVLGRVFISKHFKKPNLRPCFHQTFQVPKMEVLTYISCMDTAYGYGKTHPQKLPYRFKYLHFRYLKFWLTIARLLGILYHPKDWIMENKNVMIYKSGISFRNPPGKKKHIASTSYTASLA